VGAVGSHDVFCDIRDRVLPAAGSSQVGKGPPAIAHGQMTAVLILRWPLAPLCSLVRFSMKPPSPILAVIRGHLTVTVPVLMTIVLAACIGYLVSGRPGTLLGIVIGAILAWPVWSFLVPQWRDWVESQGLAPEDVQGLAAATGLVWPRGSFVERTEFRRKNGKRGW